MEVALSMRVSTNRQPQHQTIEQQLRRLRDYVAPHPDWSVADEHLYRDDGSSGATLKRPGLDRLRDRAAMAAFECVLLPAPDRLARHYVHQMLLVDALTQRGCRVEFVERPMSDDPGSDHGVGHPLLLLGHAKAPNCRENKAFNDLGHYSKWPKVADAVIKAMIRMINCFYTSAPPWPSTSGP
jgi:DNA invertase Pin-like site-specific DNA recombinase